MAANPFYSCHYRIHTLVDGVHRNSMNVTPPDSSIKHRYLHIFNRATISGKVSGRLPLPACWNRSGTILYRMVDISWPCALMQCPAKRALLCAITDDMGGRPP